MDEYDKWSYKIVYYVCYDDNGVKYPAFCIEPKKQGVGTGYDSYNATIMKVEDMYESGVERKNQIWRILNKGYMGTNYQSWDLECDDDLYSATKIALHSLAEGVAPNDKYILGDRSVDGNEVEDIRRRGEKVLEVSEKIYEYGLNGKEIYQEPKIEIKENGKEKIEIIDEEKYYVQNYIVSSNKKLKSYEVSIQNFPEGTKILNNGNEEAEKLDSKEFKIAIPISKIKKDIRGTVLVENAYVKTNPIYYCLSKEDLAQSYVTYTNEYEIANDKINLEIKANNSTLLIKKVDSKTDKPLSNVKFEILDSSKNKISEVLTDEKGEAKIENLYPQEIYVKEVKAQDGYILSNEEKKIELKYGEVSEVSFENEPKKAQIKIIKADKENKEIKLQGVEFAILDEENNILEKLTTDEKGEALTKEYSIKEHTKLKIQEIKTLDNYILDENIIIIELTEEGIKDVVLENEKKPELPKLPRTGF